MVDQAQSAQSAGGKIPVVLNVIGMITIGFAFLVVLMTGVAQQEAVERMNREDLTIGYSSAFALVRDLEDRRRELPTLRTRERNLSAQQLKNESDVRQTSEQFSLA